MERNLKILILLSTALSISTLKTYQSLKSVNHTDGKNQLVLFSKSLLNLLGILQKPVEVEFFVMSRCPDAMKCLSVFLPALLQLSSIVNFTISHIARETTPHEFSCMHGINECIGNKQQLCVQNTYSQTILFKYLQCQSKQFVIIPHNGERCAREISESAMNWTVVQSCVTSNKGNELFRHSVQRTHLASVKKSCTIYLNGKFWCMHDRYWSNCHEGHGKSNFIQAICSRYHGNNKPNECGNHFSFLT